MGKRILFISYDGMTDPLGQSQVIPYLIGLTKFGYSFTILSCDKPKKYATHQAYVRSLLAPFPIEWVAIPYHKYPLVISAWYDYRTLRRTALKLHRQKKFDLVHTRVGVPALVGYWLKMNIGIPFLNDIRGFWADERVDGGMWNINNPVYKYIYRYFKNKETEFIIHADYNTCLTYAAQAEMHTWSNIPNQPIPIEVIPCATDMELFDPGKINPAFQQQLKTTLNIQETDVVISYLGSIGGWYLTAEMIRFCKRLSDQMPQAKFLFISPHLHEVIEAAAVKYGLSADKLVVKNAQRSEIPALLSLSNYSIFFIKPCYSKMSSSPTKHGEIMAMGIPVITNAGVGDVAAVVNQYNAGYVVNNFTDAAFQQVIDSILAKRSFDSTAIRNGAAIFYSLTHAVELYNGVYTKIFDRVK